MMRSVLSGVSAARVCVRRSVGVGSVAVPGPVVESPAVFASSSVGVTGHSLVRCFSRSTTAASKKFDIDEDPFDPMKKRDDHAYTRTNAKYMPGFSFPAPRDLSSIVKYALLEREAPDQIEFIWEKFHTDRADCVAKVLPRSEFEGFLDRSRKNPNFVYPVKKGDGNFFVLFAQWQGRHCIFTYLEDYKRNPSLAEPYFALTMFDDLVDRKGVVLVRGDFSHHLTKPDAVKLLQQVEHHYLQDPTLVEQFNSQPEKFDFNKLLMETPE